MKVKIPIRLEKYIRKFGWPEDTDDIEFKVATRDDARPLNDLFNRVFHQERPLAHYLWKAWGGPGGRPVVVFARDRHSGRPIASMTGIRRQAWVDGRLVDVLQTCETCSDESVRGGGRAFAKTIKGGMAYAMDSERIYWSYGGQSTRAAQVVGSRWFGYVNAITLEPFELRLSVVPALIGRMGRMGRMVGRIVDRLFRVTWTRREHGYRIEESTAFGPEFDRMWEKHRDKFRVSLARDAATLDWRYAQNPKWKHRTLVAYRGDEPCGYIVWRTWSPDGVQVATVLDLWDGNDPDLAEALFDGLRRRVFTNCAFLQIAAKPGSPQRKALCRFRSCRRSPQLSKDHVQTGITQGSTPGLVPPEAIEILDAIVEGDGWYYTQGDSDLRD